MSDLSYLAIAVLFVSNLSFGVLLFRERRKAKKRRPDISAQEMLFDMMNGGTVLKIQVIDPSNLIMRSPRG